MKNTEIKAILKVERNLNDGAGVVQVYEVGNYEVVVRGQRESTGDHLWVEARRIPAAGYLPHLSVDCFDDEGYSRWAEVRIGTTSYGSLPMDEVAKFMDAMSEGFATAQHICEKFLRPMVEHRWNWEVSV